MARPLLDDLIRAHEDGYLTEGELLCGAAEIVRHVEDVVNTVRTLETYNPTLVEDFKRIWLTPRSGPRRFLAAGTPSQWVYLDPQAERALDAWIVLYKGPPS